MDSLTDVLFCMNDSVWFALGYPKQKIFENVQRKCVGIRGEEMPCDRILKDWVIGAVNKRIYDEIKGRENELHINGIYLTQNGVDTEIFQPFDRRGLRRQFTTGWAGNPTQPLKRFDLLRRVDKSLYPMEFATRWGPQFFTKDRDRSEMVNFYKHVDCFINVSEHEGMPQSLLEAGATGLPIVCTDAGGMGEFVDKEWVIPVNPIDETVRCLVEKLELLKMNPQLRYEVGQRNLQEVLNSWSWKYRVVDYDKMFSGE